MDGVLLAGCFVAIGLITYFFAASRNQGPATVVETSGTASIPTSSGLPGISGMSPQDSAAAATPQDYLAYLSNNAGTGVAAMQGVSTITSSGDVQTQQ